MKWNDDGNNNGNKDDDGNNDYKKTKMPDWIGVSRERFNEIKKEVEDNKNIFTKISKNKTINLKNTIKLIDGLNNLNPNDNDIDYETLNSYNKVKNDSIELVKIINEKGETENRVIISNIFKLIK